MKAPKVGQHKYNPGLWKHEPAPPVLTARYQAEIDASLRKAQRAWKAAEREALRVERKYTSQPTTNNKAFVDEARLLVLARLDELRQIEELMRAVPTTPVRPVRIANKSRVL